MGGGGGGGGALRPRVDVVRAFHIIHSCVAWSGEGRTIAGGLGKLGSFSSEGQSSEGPNAGAGLGWAGFYRYGENVRSDVSGEAQQRGHLSCTTLTVLDNPTR